MVGQRETAIGAVAVVADARAAVSSSAIVGRADAVGARPVLVPVVDEALPVLRLLFLLRRARAPVRRVLTTPGAPEERDGVTRPGHPVGA